MIAELDTSTLVAAAIGAAVAVLQWVSIRVSKRNEQALAAQKKAIEEQEAGQKRANEESRRLAETLVEKTDELHRLINGPLGAALAEAAAANEKVARLTGRDEDIELALTSTQKSKDHAEQQKVADDATQAAAVKRKAAIDAFRDTKEA